MQLCRRHAVPWLVALLPAFTAASGNILKKKQESQKRSLFFSKGKDGFDQIPNPLRGLFGPGLYGAEMVNPWEKSKDFRVLDDLQPTAPMDRIDRENMAAIMGEAPIGPGEKGFDHPEGVAVYAGVKPDIVPPYQHPRDFPYENQQSKCAPSSDVPLADRVIQGKADRIRQVGDWETNTMMNYPLKAPMDRIRPWPYPVAPEDRIASKYAKYFEQLYDGETKRRKAEYLADAIKTADTDGDNSISRAEFDAVIIDNQKKTKDEADTLWGRYHQSQSEDMGIDEFITMALAGFDLGFFDRKDKGPVLTLQCASPYGFWGGAVPCKEGSYVVGASIQVKPIVEGNTSVDNTALNNIKFVCDDGAELVSAGNDEGEWSEVGKCPEGQKMYGFSARNQPFGPGRDNTGINDVKFLCRSEDLINLTTIRFGNSSGPEAEGAPKSAVWAPVKVATEGGWGPEFNCGPAGMLCGLQTRVQPASENFPDGMGITNAKFFCCDSPLNCKSACKKDPAKGLKGMFDPRCQSCLAKAKGTMPVSRKSVVELDDAKIAEGKK